MNFLSFMVFFFLICFYFFTYSLYISFTPLLLVTKPPIILSSPSPLSSWGTAVYVPTLALQVSMRLNSSSPTEAR